MSDIALFAGGPRAERLLGDERLARLAGRGNARAFATLYERHHQAIYRYCRSIVGNEHDAQDALQSAMMRAYAALGRQERDLAVKPWLFRIAHNEAVTILRRRRPEDELGDELQSSAAVEPHAAMESRERLRTLVSDLGALPERQRGVLVMRELSGLSMREIAQALSISQGAAKQTLFEARSSLHELAEGRAMPCESVREAISARDGRVLRSRRIRAHLRACEGCQTFREAIAARQADLRAIAPPLPAATGGAILLELLAHGGGGHAGGAAAAAYGSSAAGSSAAGSSAAGSGAAGSGATLGGHAAASLAAKGLAGVAVVAAATAGTVHLATSGHRTHKGTAHNVAHTSSLAHASSPTARVGSAGTQPTMAHPRPSPSSIASHVAGGHTRTAPDAPTQATTVSSQATAVPNHATTAPSAHSHGSERTAPAASEHRGGLHGKPAIGHHHVGRGETGHTKGGPTGAHRSPPSSHSGARRGGAHTQTGHTPAHRSASHRHPHGQTSPGGGETGASTSKGQASRGSSDNPGHGQPHATGDQQPATPTTSAH